jgi:hypothetical protein
VRGEANFALTVNGANCISSSQVLWNGSLRATTYWNSTRLTAAIQAGDIAREGTDLITVANPSQNAATTAASPIAVQSKSPAAKTSSVSISGPNTCGDYVLILTGTDFTSEYTCVQWNGASLDSWYVSSWQFTAWVPAQQYASLVATVTMVNASGSTSAGIVLQ